MHPERARANWVGFVTIVRKEMQRVLRIWVQTLVPPVIQMTLYFLIFGSVIGSRVGQMRGFDYMAYIAPGLIMMSVVTNSYSNVVSSFFGSKFARHIEELLVSPMPNVLILLGYMAGGMARGLTVAAAVTLIASLFTHLHFAHPWVIITGGIMASAVFALGGFLTALLPPSSTRSRSSRISSSRRSSTSAAFSIRSTCCRRSGATPRMRTRCCT